MSDFKMANPWVWGNYSPLVNVETGINREGSLDLAFIIPDSTVNAGDEVVKHHAYALDGSENAVEANAVIYGHGDVNLRDSESLCPLSIL